MGEKVYTSGDLAYFRQKSQESRETKAKIYRAHVENIGKGMSVEQSCASCMERFTMYGKPITKRIFDSTLAQRGAMVDPHTAALTDAILIRALERLNDDLSLAAEHYDAQLDELDALEDAGEAFYVLEEIETEETVRNTGSKTSRVTRKKMAIPEARSMVLKRKYELPNLFFQRLTDLMPKNTVNIFNNRGEDRKLSDIEAEIAQLKSRRVAAGEK